MKKTVMMLSIVVMMLMTLAAVGDNVSAARPTGTTLQDQVLTYSVGHYLHGQPIPLGYDVFGYNYQAHIFKGYYCNIYLGGAGYPPYEGDDDAYLAENPGAAGHWAWPYRTTMVNMKWNDAWISNMDRDGDGKLDRHFGYPGYVGSGAWETNHMWDSYVIDGEIIEWDYFVKIVAVPQDAYLDGGVWYDGENNVEIGASIWGEFAIIQEVSNDPYAGDEGLIYNPEGPTGFGVY